MFALVIQLWQDLKPVWLFQVAYVQDYNLSTCRKCNVFEVYSTLVNINSKSTVEVRVPATHMYANSTMFVLDIFALSLPQLQDL